MSRDQKTRRTEEESSASIRSRSAQPEGRKIKLSYSSSSKKSEDNADLLKLLKAEGIGLMAPEEPVKSIISQTIILPEQYSFKAVKKQYAENPEAFSYFSYDLHRVMSVLYSEADRRPLIHTFIRETFYNQNFKVLNESKLEYKHIEMRADFLITMQTASEPGFIMLEAKIDSIGTSEVVQALAQGCSVWVEKGKEKPVFIVLSTGFLWYFMVLMPTKDQKAFLFSSGVVSYNDYTDDAHQYAADESVFNILGWMFFFRDLMKTFSTRPSLSGSAYEASLKSLDLEACLRDFPLRRDAP